MTTLATKQKKFRENCKQIKTLETRNETLLEQIRAEQEIHPEGTIIAHHSRVGGRSYWKVRVYRIDECDLSGSTIGDACTARGERLSGGCRHPIRIQDNEMHEYEVIDVEANREP